MAIQNDFLPFSAGAGANVVDQATYATLGELSTGFLSGVAKSGIVNKVLRQSSIMSAVLSQFIVDNTGSPATDDGTTATLLANLKAAINAAGITAPQFDNSKKYATTEFVARAVQGLIQKFTSKSANYSVLASDAGTMFYCSAAITYTLPDATTCNGVAFGFSNNAGYAPTIKTVSSQLIISENLSTSSLTLSKNKAMAIVESDGSNWIVTYGTPAVNAPNVAPLTNFLVFIAGTSSSGSVSVSFTAPRNGYVYALGSINVASQLSGSGVTVSLNINGTMVSRDQTQTTQFHHGVLYVTQGTAVTVQTAATTDANGAGGISTNLRVGAFFVPYN